MSGPQEVKTVHILLRHLGKFLVLSHKKHGTTDIGGKIEEYDEDTTACLHREVAEEICGNDEGAAKTLLDACTWGEAHYIPKCKSEFRLLTLGDDAPPPAIDLSHEDAHTAHAWVTRAWLMKHKDAGDNISLHITVVSREMHERAVSP